MFLQSHAGVVHLRPAIPPASMGLPSGSPTGWVVRGGFNADLTWQNGAVMETNIKSLLRIPLKLRVNDGLGFKVDGVVVELNSALIRRYTPLSNKCNFQSLQSGARTLSL
ncbi:hypothetical protein F4824DRAFT_459415 [Ustulina deusta]|nr:hypothetical protein F4824DRAFT_459415 [Ustulina deusta]